MTVEKALELIEASVAAYRALYRDNPQDYAEAADRQQEAADLLDDAQRLGSSLTGDEARQFSEAFAPAVLEIERLEHKRVVGGYEDEE